VRDKTDATLKYISDMKARYTYCLNALFDYRVCGLGWIEHRLHMMFTVIVAGNLLNDHSVDSKTSNITLAPGQVSVFIVDVVGKHKCKSVDSNGYHIGRISLHS
jgi:hypothetical protein